MYVHTRINVQSCLCSNKCENLKHERRGESLKG